ncbi:DUF6247 family protein [Streptomyces sp. NBC_00103]|uniref:DUF6247 family protein n=1 Tax=Streptomyces sp. NBC_00103 TaxID=2975653 RepID=UPI00225B4BE7|nr:DUF6247 family protein [Streptomyces sp. NBC_00103]MCX5374788.1 DUF6247 family protein [Streptomyces sp. NBC_00103]
MLADLRADRRAGTWVPAFEQDWARALDDARHSYSLAPLHDVYAPGRPGSPPRRPWTRSLRAAATTPTASTSTRSSEPARERRAVLVRPAIPQAAATARELPDHARAILRDVLDIAARDPWSFPPFNARDPEGEDVRSAVYWINRPAARLCVVDIVWIG